MEFILKLIPAPLIKAMIESAVRHGVTALGAIAIKAGIGTDEMWVTITGTAIMIAGMVWSYVNKKTAAKKAGEI